jgi:carbamoyl-phosphate synthase small subunit
LQVRQLLAAAQTDSAGFSSSASPVFPFAVLALADGTVFECVSIGASGQTIGEVVFNTALTGYQEILTDPSYCQQLVTLTYPHIGNTGWNEEDNESSGVQAAGLIIRDLPQVVSNFRSQRSLPEALTAAGVVAIAGVDTRALTRRLRETGAQSGAILTAAAGSLADEDRLALAARAVDLARGFAGLVGADLAQGVSTKKAYTWTEGTWRLAGADAPAVARQAKDAPHVVAYDFGIKHNILRLLADRGAKITVVPAKTSYAEALALKPQGIFLSNGPGDPQPCDYAIAVAKQAMADKLPLFGICLGHQIMALAAGAKTLKMKFGHHGANHPVQDLASGRVFITSQNHGFAVDPQSLPAYLKVTHVSLFDGSVQGLAHTQAPAYCFQGHPEASPGPHDIIPLFDPFFGAMAQVVKGVAHA